MKKIFNDACDKNVAVRVVYADASNNLFYDESCEIAVEATDALNLFLKGVVAIKSGVYYNALSCTEDGEINFGFQSGDATGSSSAEG